MLFLLVVLGLMITMAHELNKQRAELDALRAENYQLRAFLHSTLLGEEYQKWQHGQQLSAWLWRRGPRADSAASSVDSERAAS